MPPEVCIGGARVWDGMGVTQKPKTTEHVWLQGT